MNTAIATVAAALATVPTVAYRSGPIPIQTVAWVKTVRPVRAGHTPDVQELAQSAMKRD
jgi:hypothetical protein